METKLNSGKHLYKRGWLGLIPLIGGFIGIGLILSGLVKYKDRKLVLIGVAALSFTVLIYSSMFYYFNYSKQARKDFSVFTRPKMDHLIKSIEFYKIQNGAYPDSLEELLVTDKMISIYDPILMGKPEINHRKFYYKKENNKYFLFSLGIDRVPFTEDDIFPSPVYFDSSKTGLIRPVK